MGAKSGAKNELKMTINKQAIKEAKTKVKKDKRDRSKEKQPRNEIKKVNYF